MNTKGPFIITITGPNISSSICVEFERLDLTVEFGFKEKPLSESDKFSWANDPESNGHKRMSIKAWSGCETFETFEAKTYVK